MNRALSDLQGHLVETKGGVLPPDGVNEGPEPQTGHYAAAYSSHKYNINKFIFVVLDLFGNLHCLVLDPLSPFEVAVWLAALRLCQSMARHPPYQ
jgi:hypothetical protein